MATTMPPHVRLVNEISRQFAHRPPADAANAVANHLRTVWDPRMKQALIAHLQAGGEDLDPIALLAAENLSQAVTAGAARAAGTARTAAGAAGAAQTAGAASDERVGK